MRSRARRTRWMLAFGCAVVVTILAQVSSAMAQAPHRLVVRGTGDPLGETPLTIELDKKVYPNFYVLTRESDNHTLPALVHEYDDRLFLSLVLDRVPAGGEEDRYTVKIRTTEDALPPGVELAHGPDGRLDILVGGQPFTTLVSHDGPKPYLFPLIGPNGQRFTRAFPMEEVEGEDRDHPHQRSFWFSHGEVNGIDFWGSDPLNRPRPNHGTIRERYRRSHTIQNGGPVALVQTQNDWLAPDGRTLCEEARTLRVYATQTTRVLDIDITLRATAEGPVTFGDTKEGTFGIRVASTMNVDRDPGGRILNAEGLTDADAWGQASPWVDYTGPVGGETVGIAILNHPDSFRFPTTWHVRTYGLFAANPFGWTDFGRDESGEHTLQPGESITLRYRVILHKGDTETADIPGAFRAYSEPPVIEIQTE